MINFRRQLIVHPRIQYLLLTLSLAFLIIGGAVTLNLVKLLETQALSDELTPTQHYIPIFGLTLLVFISMLAANLLVSNRIVGPVYRLKRYMDSIANGQDLGAMKVRDDDYFSEVAESYNKMLEKIKSK